MLFYFWMLHILYHRDLITYLVIWFICTIFRRSIDILYLNKSQHKLLFIFCNFKKLSTFLHSNPQSYPHCPPYYSRFTWNIKGPPFLISFCEFQCFTWNICGLMIAILNFYSKAQTITGIFTIISILKQHNNK